MGNQSPGVSQSGTYQAIRTWREEGKKERGGENHHLIIDIYIYTPFALDAP